MSIFDFEEDDVLQEPYQLVMRRISRNDAAELYDVLDLIVVEFESDPHSVQCFDLRIVERSKSIRNKVRGW